MTFSPKEILMLSYKIQEKFKKFKNVVFRLTASLYTISIGDSQILILVTQLTHSQRFLSLLRQADEITIKHIWPNDVVVYTGSFEKPLSEG